MHATKDGGGCCAAFHISEIYHEDKKELKSYSLSGYRKNIMYGYEGETDTEYDFDVEDVLPVEEGGSFLEQIILNESQVETFGDSTLKAMKEEGWVFVTKWNNFNTGVDCYLFIKHGELGSKSMGYLPSDFPSLITSNGQT